MKQFILSILLIFLVMIPVAVIAMQSFGDFLGFNPHTHILGTDGCFYGKAKSIS